MKFFKILLLFVVCTLTRASADENNIAFPVPDKDLDSDFSIACKVVGVRDNQPVWECCAGDSKHLPLQCTRLVNYEAKSDPDPLGVMLGFAIFTLFVFSAYSGCK